MLEDGEIVGASVSAACLIRVSAHVVGCGTAGASGSEPEVWLRRVRFENITPFHSFRTLLTASITTNHMQSITCFVMESLKDSKCRKLIQMAATAAGSKQE